MKFPKPWFRKGRGWFVTLGGKQINLGTQRDEAFAAYRQLIAHPQTSQAPDATNILIVEIVEHFLDWVQRNRAADTYEWYRFRLERFCRAYSELSVRHLKPYIVQEWVNGFEPSITSQRNYLRSAKRCFKWAKQQGYIEKNPIVDLEVPTAEQRETALSQIEFEAIMPFVKNERFRELLRLTWATGCRPQESLRVEARHVDTTHQRWVFPRSESKMKRKSRVVYLTDEAMEITKRLMAANPKGTLFRNANGKPWNKDSVGCSFLSVQVRMGKVAMIEHGIEIDDEAINKFIPLLKPKKVVQGIERLKRPAELRHEAKRKLTIKKACEFAPRYSLYALRHSFATIALQKGIDSLTVAILLGHEDPSTLARVYQHLNHNPKHLLEEMRKATS
jgi:integrase